MIDSTPDPLDADLERWQQHDVVQIRQTCGLGECRQEPRTNDAVMNHPAFYSFVFVANRPDTDPTVGALEATPRRRPGFRRRSRREMLLPARSRLGLISR
jgi:hypothetical protein